MKIEQGIVKRNLGLQVRILFVALIGLALTAYNYLSQLEDPSLIWMILLTLSAVLMLALFVHAARNLIIQKPALVLTKEGLVDHISLARAGLIPWKSIKSVKAEKYLNREHILIEVSDAQSIIEKLPYVRKKMVDQQFRDTGSVIVIDPKTIKTPSSQLVKMLKKRARS